MWYRETDSPARVGSQRTRPAGGGWDPGIQEEQGAERQQRLGASCWQAGQTDKATCSLQKHGGTQDTQAAHQAAALMDTGGRAGTRPAPPKTSTCGCARKGRHSCCGCERQALHRRAGPLLSLKLHRRTSTLFFRYWDSASLTNCGERREEGTSYFRLGNCWQGGQRLAWLSLPAAACRRPRRPTPAR